MSETKEQIAARWNATAPENLEIKVIPPGVSGIWDEFGNLRVMKKSCMGNKSAAAGERVRKEIRQHLSRGLTTEQIAKNLGRHIDTIRRHIERIQMEDRENAA